MTFEYTERERIMRGMREAAVRAGALIMRFYEADFTVRQKADHSPVTDADEASSRLILAALEELAPEIPAVCEEAVAAGQAPAIAGRFFLVDPLDGTKEFISKNGEFTVNIALIDRGRPVAGTVYVPVRKRLFSGWWDGAEKAAFEQEVDPRGAPELVLAGAPRPIAARWPATDGLVVVASRSHRDAATDTLLEKYPVKSFVAAGSSLKFCLLAAGEADFYPRLGPTMEWDTAAGQAVLEAAGGSVLTLDGSPLAYGKQSFKNPFFMAWGAASLHEPG